MPIIREVHPPETLERNLLAQVDEYFAASVKQMNASKLSQVERSFAGKIETIERSGVDWLIELAHQMVALHDEHARLAQLPESNPKALNCIRATLLYFVNAHDVIPDHHGPYGYVDDAYVLNKCVSLLRIFAPELVT